MRSSPLYALLCFQLAFAPVAVAAGQPTWEAKRAHLASEIKEALGSLDVLDRTGPACSDNYLKSQCPSIMPPPKQTFVEAARKNLKALEQEVNGIADEAKIADAPFDPKKAPAVDGCSGAGTAVATDAAKRKAAVDKMNTVFAKVNSSISSDLGKLFEGGASFQAKVKSCVNASSLNFIEKAVVNANLPEYPHGALDYMWTPDSKHPNCSKSGVDTFRKLTGTRKGDGKAQLAQLAGQGKEFAAALAKSSADLSQHTQVAGKKLDCNSADKTQLAEKPKDDKKPDISGDTEEKPATVAAAEEKPKQADQPPAKDEPVVTEKPADETAATTSVATTTTDTAPLDTATNEVIPEPTPLTPEKPPAEQKAGLSKGAVIGGLAVLGVGAGAAYLIFSKKDKDSDSSDRIPGSVNTKTNSNTQTATKTGTKTATSTGTKTNTNTSTITGPISTTPYTGTLTATTLNTSTQTSSDTATQSDTLTATDTATSTATSTNTDTRE